MLQDTNLPDFENILVVVKQVDQFSRRVEKIENELGAVKKSLNPTNSELLSVARLGDKFELILNKIMSIEERLQGLEKEVDAKLSRNYDVMTAQVDRIVDMLKWVGLLLIPIILTTIK